MNKFGKLGLVVGILPVAAIATWVVLHKPSPKTGLGVRVGANLPLSGPLATYGAAVREGVTLALEDLKKISDRRLEFDWQDNASEPKTAVTILQKQFLDPPDVYVSGVKPQTMAIKDQVAAKGIPHFVWIFDAFINRDSTNNLRTWVSYKIEAPVYLAYAKERSSKRVAIVHVQLPHAIEEFSKIVVPGLKAQGVEEVMVEPFDLGKADFKDVGVKFENFRPDLIILNGFQSDMIALVRALRPLGLISDGNTIATYDMLDAAKVLGADELEGIRVVAPVFETRPDSSEIAQWREQFMKRFHKSPLYTHAFAYDMALIIDDAAKRLKPPSSPVKWLEALRATDLKGVTGPLKFDNDGDLITPLEVGVYREGKLVPVNAK
jgi:branched-chain amino acid transport system substrate-binding protein